ncbi:hypothetical protein [Kitasatospora sp. NPDC008115]|uniref:hypothetical protein n=1 Tax=Kitasatospora sp. NPDC008115 TaxID=3364022 RepID=UPI0036E0B877
MTDLPTVLAVWLVWVLFTLLFVAAPWIRSNRRPGRILQVIRPLRTFAWNRHLAGAHRVRDTLRQHGASPTGLPDCDAMARRSAAVGAHKAGVLLTWAVPFLLVLAATAAQGTGWGIGIVYGMLLTTTGLALADARATARGTVFASTTRAAMNVAELLGTGEEAVRLARGHQSRTQALSAAVNTLCRTVLLQATALSARTDPHARTEIVSNAENLLANLKDERTRLLQRPQDSQARIAELCAAVLTGAVKPHESALHSLLVADPAVLRTEMDWRPARSPRRHTALAVTVQTVMVLALLGVVVSLTHFQVPEAVLLLVFVLMAALFARILAALDLPATDWLRISRR